MTWHNSTTGGQTRNDRDANCLKYSNRQTDTPKSLQLTNLYALTRRTHHQDTWGGQAPFPRNLVQVMMEVQPYSEQAYHSSNAHPSCSCQSCQFPGIKHLKEEYPDLEKPTLNTSVSHLVNSRQADPSQRKSSPAFQVPSDPNLISPPKRSFGTTHVD